MGYSQILFDVEERVATITLNRPEHMNAWTEIMAGEMYDAMHRCNEDDDIRAVVMTGTGERAFCAGADLGDGETAFAGDENPERENPATTDTRLGPQQISKPVIAAINGHAVGIGITYPMLADIRIVSENAKIAFAFVRRGVLPELASHVTVAKVAGLSNAAELLLTGKTITGKEAAELGIASRALPQAEVLPAALEIARDIATYTAPASVAAAKRLLWEGIDKSVAEMMAREVGIFAWLDQQEDAREGARSFLEKRPPQWTLSANDVPEDLMS